MTDLHSPEDEAFYSEARTWFEANTPAEIRGDAFMFGSMTPEQNVAWSRKLNEKGWLTINWPLELGGKSWSQTRKHLFEKARADAGSPLPFNIGVTMLGPVIYTFGNQAQKDYFLPRIRNFEDWWCQGYSEPGAGSDLASLKTRAERQGAHYIVNGSKIWTSYAHCANRMFALVRTDSSGKKQEGISFLLLDMDTPGIQVRPLVSIDGRHHLNQVFFDNVRVPAENLVGEEGQGWTIAKYLLTHERTANIRLPMVFVAMRRLKRLALENSGAGRLIDQENLAQRIAEAEIDLACLDDINTQMIAAADAGHAPGVESSLLKVRGTEIQQNIMNLILEVCGYRAYPFNTELSGEDREVLQAAANHNFSRAASIFAGSNEIQRDVMAKRLLGL
ncbi:MAG: acyl-CoA dehydrogenase family protein [Gammaproteobacteria bacterium]|nr:acyl-CoA dehydrogenase family protein [Gammaproteobacteria bacterium]